jgi:hypothetical protein
MAVINAQRGAGFAPGSSRKVNSSLTMSPKLKAGGLFDPLADFAIFYLLFNKNVMGCILPLH